MISKIRQLSVRSHRNAIWCVLSVIHFIILCFRRRYWWKLSRLL